MPDLEINLSGTSSKSFSIPLAVQGRLNARYPIRGQQSKLVTALLKRHMGIQLTEEDKEVIA